MNYFLFIVGSTFEYIGTLLFLFTLFRFGLDRRLIINVLLVSLLMSQASYFSRLDPAVGDLSSYIQFILFVLVLWILFRVPIFHSIIMNFAGIAALFTVQGLIILVASQVSDTSFSTITSNHATATAVQIITCLANIAIARTVYIKNWGFDFVPTSRRVYVEIRGTNAILLAIIAFAIVLAAILAVVFRNNYDEYVIAASVVFLLTLPLFLYFTLRKDTEDAA
ncbi:hypothetical protein [Paenibacillus sp. CF384]|uniref:hypothetical protein n=1 Tax=Paenibacillus sp. CF384 TaxID=1884382 RepID=UPI00089B6B8E|nr:hypothetical protein [Paenibacillus sp. CF384]SDX81747.1 hypothetical protein SAMN05518855_10237 [Paenibacillus sp. CF384]